MIEPLVRARLALGLRQTRPEINMDIHSAARQRAVDDEASLHLSGLPDVPFGQHTQRAVEKLFNALIHEHGQKYP